MDEHQILGLITSHSTWEDVIYKIIGFEGLDPWNLDLGRLTQAFLVYLRARESVDFVVPAKFVIIAAVLLRMKSEQLDRLDELIAPPEQVDLAPLPGGVKTIVEPLELPTARLPTRRIMVGELIGALRKVLTTEERRRDRRARLPVEVRFEEEDIGARIAALTKRIELLLTELKHEEIPFSRLVTSWDRDAVVDVFLPLIYLDNEQKVRCRQDEPFAEIYIRKPEAVEEVKTLPPVAGMPVEIKPAQAREKALLDAAEQEAAEGEPTDSL